MSPKSIARTVLFLILMAIMIVMVFGISGQVIKYGVMVMAAVSSGEGVSGTENAASIMSKTNEFMASLSIIITALVSIFVVKKYAGSNERVRWEFLRRMFLYEILMAGVILVLFPFFWMLCTAFKPAGQELLFAKPVGQEQALDNSAEQDQAPLHANPFDIIPESPTFDNFRRVLKIDSKSKSMGVIDPVENKKNFGTYFLNSLLVSTTAAFLVTFFSAMAAYVFSKKPLPFKKNIFIFLLATMMIPGMMFMVPQFFMICKMGLFGTKWAMFLPHLASVFGVFMLKQFMDTIPDSLLEAAQIDGASEWQVFRVVIIPLSIPIILTLFLLTFLSNWSNFLWQLIVTDFENPLSITLPVGLALFRGQYVSELGLIMSASCFSIVPVAVLFLFAQRYFIEGMTQGAVKE
ncbi:MAG: carbohydrate ABC transporter permease [Candidatus Riflebacteria bacterium]|nr:carbohydrate ABC transporter permease [Candidatus Riflebacteria bacterium]